MRTRPTREAFTHHTPDMPVSFGVDLEAGEKSKLGGAGILGAFMVLSWAVVSHG
jgi:hypothetical protein